MQPSTLVLTALLQVHTQIIDDDGFCGYIDDSKGTEQLHNELWDLYYAPFQRAETPEELVNAWYENAYAQLEN